MKYYVAIVNTPGFLPESEPVEFVKSVEAWNYLSEQYLAMGGTTDGAAWDDLVAAVCCAGGVHGSACWHKRPDDEGVVYWRHDDRILAFEVQAREGTPDGFIFEDETGGEGVTE